MCGELGHSSGRRVDVASWVHAAPCWPILGRCPFLVRMYGPAGGLVRGREAGS
jgi:hypothetical protein